MPSSVSRYENEKVVLTCETSMLKDGNSPCSTFIWTNSKDFHETFIDTSELTFLMKEHHQGSYRCKCENEYGMSEESEEVEILFLNSTSLSKITFYILEKIKYCDFHIYRAFVAQTTNCNVFQTTPKVVKIPCRKSTWTGP